MRDAKSDRKLRLERCEDRLLLAVSTFSNKNAFMAETASPTTYNFESNAGFSSASAGQFKKIGIKDGIEFDAAVTNKGSIKSQSGSQIMTGSSGFDDTGVLEFDDLPNRPTAVGFFALDLDSSKTLRVAVDFAKGEDRIFDVKLGQRAAGTPVFFGVSDPNDTIVDVAIFAQSSNSFISPLESWAIDDLVVNRPEGNSDPVIDPVGSLDIVVRADIEFANFAGQEFSYTITVRNTGDAPLTGINLPQGNADAPPVYMTGDANNNGRLDTGEVWTFNAIHTVTNAEVNDGDIVVVGRVESNETGPAAARATVKVSEAVDLAIQIAADVDSVDSVGDKIGYTYRVNHNGSSGLTGITLRHGNTDAAPVYVTGDSNNNNRLDANETWTYSATHTVTQADLNRNEIVVMATVSSNEAGTQSKRSAVTVNTNSGGITADDVDHVCRAIHEGNFEEAFDVNGDGVLNHADLRQLVKNDLRSAIGDSNHDGVFNSSDLVLALSSGEYEDGITGNSSWSEGDWNCDGEFDSTDIITAFAAGEYVAGAGE